MGFPTILFLAVAWLVVPRYWPIYLLAFFLPTTLYGVVEFGIKPFPYNVKLFKFEPRLIADYI